MFVVDGSPDRSAGAAPAAARRLADPRRRWSCSRATSARSPRSAPASRRPTATTSRSWPPTCRSHPSCSSEFVERLDDRRRRPGARRARGPGRSAALSRVTSGSSGGSTGDSSSREMPRRRRRRVRLQRRGPRPAILELRESNSSLVGLLLWLGFRRATVPYDRQPRPTGKSGWTFAKKLRYMADSIFSFTDLPIRLLLVGRARRLRRVVVVAARGGRSRWVARRDRGARLHADRCWSILFVGFVLTFGLGIVGSYVWRTYENTKRRPLTVAPDRVERVHRRTSRSSDAPSSCTRRALCESTPVGARHAVWAFAHVLPGARDRRRLQHLRRRLRRERRRGRRPRDGQVRRAAVGRAAGRRRRVHRAQRHVHQRPVPPQQARPAPSSCATEIHEGASIGANATILPGVDDRPAGDGRRRGGGHRRRARPTPRSSATRRASSATSTTCASGAAPPAAPSGRRDRRPTLPGGAASSSCRSTDLRGALVAGELDDVLPFVPQRYFVVFDVPSRARARRARAPQVLRSS